MNAVVVWVFLPFGIAAGLYLFSTWGRRTEIVAAGVSGGLALLALLVPIEQPLRGTLRLESTWTFLGRSITLVDATRPWLVWWYFGLCVWLLGAHWMQAPPALPAASLGSTALWVAALTITPFVYAPILWFLGLLLWLPVLANRRGPQTRAVLRLLNLQFLAVPALLAIGWMLSRVESVPGQEALALRIGVLMTTSMALLLGVFPFHVWYPGLVADSHPYAAGMLLYFLPQTGMWMGLTFLERFSWLRSAPQVQFFLYASGIAMLVAGGVLAALERHLGRAWGYLIMADVGAALLAVSLFPEQGISLFLAALWPRFLALFTGTLAVSFLGRQRGSLRFSALMGSALQWPVVAGSLLCAVFSLGGFPLLAAFPVRLALWEALPVLPMGVGMAAMLVIALRLLAVLVMGEQPAERQKPPLGLLLLLGLGVLLLLGTGWLPGVFLPLMRSLEGAFPHLVVL